MEYTLGGSVGKVGANHKRRGVKMQSLEPEYDIELDLERNDNDKIIRMAFKVNNEGHDGKILLAACQIFIECINEDRVNEENCVG